MLLQVGHANKITGIVSSADSRMIVSASMDSTLRAWAVEPKSLVRVLTGHSVGVTALGLSKDGRWLISGGGRSRVLVHDVTHDFAAKRILRQPHDRRIERVLFLPDGAHFVTVDQDGKSFRWNLAEPTLEAQAWLADQECRREAAGGDADTGKVAVLCGNGDVLILGPSGSTGNPDVFKPPTGEVSAMAMSPDGRWLALGRDNGAVLLRDLTTRKQVDRKLADSAIQQLELSRREALAVVHEQGVAVFPVSKGLDSQSASVIPAKAVQALSFSPSGGNLAIATRDEGVSIWSLDGGKPAKASQVASSNSAACLSFTSDGRNLVVGGLDGSLLFQPMEAPGVAARRIPPHRGMVRQLGISPRGQSLLIGNELNQLQICDPRNRTCVRLPGYWSGAAFLDDETLLLAAAGNPEHPENSVGWLARMDRTKHTIDRGFFAREAPGYKIPDTVAFEAVTLSPDRKRLAATVPDSAVPLVCVWDVKSGKLTHWLTQIQDPVRSASFSTDGHSLATAGDSPSAQLWQLDAAGGEIKRPTVTLLEATSANVTCVQIRPGASRQLVTGHSDGRAILWSWRESKATVEAPHLVEGVLDGAVKAIAFTPNGRTLAVAGDGTTIWLGELEPKPRRLDLDQQSNHFEQVNALAPWFDGSLLLSGSDDTTVRFWDLEKRVLKGTFATAASPLDDDQTVKPEASTESDWVFYAPDGRFDASARGRGLVRFRQRDRARPMEQFDATLYTFGLGEQMISQEIPKLTEETKETPPLAIDAPLRPDPAQPETQLSVHLGAPDLTDFRLYHNGIPISSKLEEKPGPLPTEFRVRVRLRSGDNRFYAMASRQGSYDSRSPEPDLEIPCAAKMEPGKVHILSLGVGKYTRQRLNFPVLDAEQLSELLHQRGLDPQGRGGLRILRSDDQVNLDSVNQAFRELEKAVRDHPQDTVVVFLAGHTGVFDKGRFCLLLPSFPFPQEAALQVAERGDAPDLAPGIELKPADYLPFSVIALNLMRLDALNRLVIVDACQAEAILSDPKVAAIRKWAEIESRKARTSYLMAARRGEAALEVEPLGHGLFTFTLLRAMGGITQDQEPEELNELKLRGTADYDGDGTLTTHELDRYVKETLPQIAAKFPLMVAKARSAQALPGAKNPADQALRLQTSNVSFPLFRIDPSRK